MKKNFEITSRRFNERIWPVPSDFVKSSRGSTVLAFWSEHPKRDQPYKIYSSKRDDEHPRLFYIGVPSTHRVFIYKFCSFFSKDNAAMALRVYRVICHKTSHYVVVQHQEGSALVWTMHFSWEPLSYIWAEFCPDPKVPFTWGEIAVSCSCNLPTSRISWPSLSCTSFRLPLEVGFTVTSFNSIPSEKN